MWNSVFLSEDVFTDLSFGQTFIWFVRTFSLCLCKYAVFADLIWNIPSCVFFLWLIVSLPFVFERQKTFRWTRLCLNQKYLKKIIINQKERLFPSLQGQLLNPFPEIIQIRQCPVGLLVITLNLTQSLSWYKITEERCKMLSNHDGLFSCQFYNGINYRRKGDFFFFHYDIWSEVQPWHKLSRSFPFLFVCMKDLSFSEETLTWSVKTCKALADSCWQVRVNKYKNGKCFFSGRGGSFQLSMQKRKGYLLILDNCLVWVWAGSIFSWWF